MIRYSLACPCGHSFESWFRDSSAFDELAARGQVSCPDCASLEVRKAPMAPSVLRTRKPRAPAATAESPKPDTPSPQPAPLLDARERKLRDLVRELHRKVTETGENVGGAFPEEARKIHEGEAPARFIYGEATGQEVKTMVEDGIPFLPLPTLPDDRH